MIQRELPGGGYASYNDASNPPVLPADVACERHPTVRAEACEICNCRECGEPIDKDAPLGSDTCTKCMDKADDEHEQNVKDAIRSEDDHLAGLPDEMVAAILTRRLGWLVTEEDVRRNKEA